MASMEINSKTPIENAIEAAGGITKMAKDLGLSSHMVIYQWSKNRIPADRCPDIEALTGIKCEQLRPDVNWAVLRASNPANPRLLKPSNAASNADTQ